MRYYVLEEMDMSGIDKKSGIPRDSEKEKMPVPAASGNGNEDCRCKETSHMKPGQLLRVMMNDLAFWRRQKKD